MIDSALVLSLISSQFPKWKDLAVWPVAHSGWDNRTFHLGDEMLVRLPSAMRYEAAVEREHQWLPKLAPLVPLQIPVPLAMGKPAQGYPWKWSIYQWIHGDASTSGKVANLSDFAASLAKFLIAFQRINPKDGPLPGPENFYRGGKLTNYDSEMRQAIFALKGKIDVDTVTEIWEEALATNWHRMPVWVHGDMSASNLIVLEGKLNAVIDFGQIAIGDPACDLEIAWTFFKGESRNVFCSMLPLGKGTWARARAWTLWKFLMVAAGLTDWNGFEENAAWSVINEVLEDHKSKG